MIKNKLFLCSVLCASLIPFHAEASEVNDKSGKFYIKFEGGLAKLDNRGNIKASSEREVMHLEFDDLGFQNFQANSYSSKSKSNNFLLGGFGIGYYAQNSTRAELIFSHLRETSKYRGKFNIVDIARVGIGGNGSGYVKIQNRVYNVSLKLLQDIIDFNAGSLFVSGGFGISKIESKYKSAISGDIYSPGYRYEFTNSQKTQDKIDFSGQAGAGVSFNLSDSLSTEFSYNFNYYGKTKGDEEGDDKQKLFVHTLMLGLRIDL